MQQVQLFLDLDLFTHKHSLSLCLSLSLSPILSAGQKLDFFLHIQGISKLFYLMASSQEFPHLGPLPHLPSLLSEIKSSGPP